MLEQCWSRKHNVGSPARQLPVRCFFPLHAHLPCAPSTPLGSPFISNGGVPHQTLPQWPKHPHPAMRDAHLSLELIWPQALIVLSLEASTNTLAPPPTSLPKCLEARTTTGWQGPRWDGMDHHRTSVAATSGVWQGPSRDSKNRSRRRDTDSMC